MKLSDFESRADYMRAWRKSKVRCGEAVKKRMLNSLTGHLRDKWKIDSFELTSEQVGELIGQPCTYCGYEPEDDERNGIDRVDSEVGYTPDNCVPCCSTCNTMKSNMSVEKFLDHVARIVAHSKVEA